MRKAFNNGFTLLEVLLSAAILLFGVIALGFITKTVLDCSQSLGGTTVFQKEIDGLIRGEIDASRSVIVTANNSSMTAVANGSCLTFTDPAGTVSRLSVVGAALVLKRGAQTGFPIITDGVSNAVFGCSSGPITVHISSSTGVFDGTYELRRTY